MSIGTKKYNIGEVFKTNEGYEIEIIEYINRSNIIIRFLDKNKYEKNVKAFAIESGAIKNPYHISVYGVGYFGVGEYTSIRKNYNLAKCYDTWRDMLRRCYDKNLNSRNPTYLNVSVCSEWLCFQSFAKWYFNNKPNLLNIKFQLDKDLLQQGVENKIYSPETCIFLPQKINNFFTNNQLKNNTSGFIGVSWRKKNSKWVAQINDFNTGKYIYIKDNCETKEEASKLYQEYRDKNAEKVKGYLRSLNYLPEEIIELVR